LICLFRFDLPWLAQEWHGDQLVAEYLVKQTARGLSPVPAGTLEAADARELERAQAQLAEIEAEMQDSERELKKALREEDQNLRRKRASVAGARKRQSMLGRAAAKGAATQAAFGGMWKGALSKSGF
jgi:hypothetical protein